MTNSPEISDPQNPEDPGSRAGELKSLKIVSSEIELKLRTMVYLAVFSTLMAVITVLVNFGSPWETPHRVWLVKKTLQEEAERAVAKEMEEVTRKEISDILTAHLEAQESYREYRSSVPRPPDWEKEDREDKLGDAEIEIVSVEIAPPYRVPPAQGKEFPQPRDQLLVRIRIANRTQVKRVDFRPFAAHDFRGPEMLDSNGVPSKTSHSSLQDEHGNEYPFEERTAWVVRGNVVSTSYDDRILLDPGETHEQVLAFAKPVPQATTLRLTLLGNNVRAAGQIAYLQFPLPNQNPSPATSPTTEKRARDEQP